MRRNRRKRVETHGVVPMVAGLVVLGLLMLLGYWVIDANCAELGQEIRRNEQRLAALEDERVREQARWDEKKTPERLAEAFLQHGIAMAYPQADQVVRMDASGRPVEGQLALRRFRAGWSGGTAAVEPAASRR